HGAWSMEKHLKGTRGLAPLYITYRELNKRSDQLSLHLKEKGVKPDTIVGLMVKRTVEMIIGILGILKAGGAYLPIDPGFPAERINYMLADSSAKILVTTQDLTKKVEFEKAIIYLSDALNRVPTPYHLNLPTAPANCLAYVIYTSGSTGKPKGVMIHHQAVHNFIIGMTKRINFTPGKTILALTTISFDIFVLETLLPLLQGLRIVIADEHHQLDINLLEELIVKTGVDMLQATPTRMQMFTAHARPTSCLENLKEIMVGGEPFPGKLLGDLKQLTSAMIYNMYGPTETTVWSTMKDLTHRAIEEINIGQPIANTQIYILDKNGQPQPLGVIGDLYIGGDGLARGYINHPELTLEKYCLRRPGGRFLKKLPPWTPRKNFLLKGTRGLAPLQYAPLLYRTGDLSRWLPDGNIEFFGRIDSQVKIRGFRIELEEIETRLNEHSAVKESVVTINTDKSAAKSLCAYLVSDETLTASELRNYLQKKLPDYMIPSYFMQLEKIPLTPNGKVDRKSLPGPDKSLKAASEYAAPTNETEKQLVKIWQELLKVKKIGIKDNFFELGGHSLLAMNMVLRIQACFGMEISLVEIFDNPRIAQISRHIQTREEKIKKFEQILLEIESLGDEQVEKLLSKGTDR
ncbi:MAG: non-ribosomal peptide synthetase, partial [Candidatus Aminicenantes bacterium]